MNIAIVGGGNIGTLLAAEMAARGNRVSLYTRDAQRWSPQLTVFDVDDRVVCIGEPALITNDLAEAVADAEYIWITHPTYQFEDIAHKMLPLVRPGMKLGIALGAVAEFYFREHVACGCTMFGLQRVHSIARIKERGKSVYMLGRKDEVQVATIPAAESVNIVKDVGALIDMPAVALPNYLVLTLTPSNPILHTTRIRTMFSDWQQGRTYPENFLFYESWDDESSKLLLAADAEVQAICHALDVFDLSQVRSLREYYESPSVQAMTAKLTGIPAFHGLKSPMKRVEDGGWVPDFSLRYFAADFAFGLRAIQQIGDLCEVDTPHIDDIWNWYVALAQPTAVFEAAPKSKEELIEIYR